MLFLIKKEFDFDLNDIYFLIQQIFVTNQNFTIQNKKNCLKLYVFPTFLLIFVQIPNLTSKFFISRYFQSKRFVCRDF